MLRFETMEKLAKLISIILGPHIWLPLVFLTLLFESNLNKNQLLVLIPSVLILQVFLPLAYLLLAPKLGWVSAWDMKTRKERTPMLFLVLVAFIVSTLIIYIFGDTLLFHLSIIMLFLSASFLIINQFWKISLHAGLNTTGSIFINFLFGWKLPWLYLTIPIIYWSRLYLKKHTPLQLIAGTVVGATEIIFGLYFFGYGLS